MMAITCMPIKSCLVGLAAATAYVGFHVGILLISDVCGMLFENYYYWVKENSRRTCESPRVMTGGKSG